MSKCKKKTCINENCNEIAKYGLINQQTRMFEKFHCKNHKENDEIGTPPKYEFRYTDMKLITINKNVKLLDTDVEYIEKCKKDGKNAYLLLQCLVCLDKIKTTSIDNFIHHGCIGCSCNNKIPWYERYPEFLEICKDNNVILLDSEEEFIEKTKKKAKYTKLNLQCLICNTIVTTTTIGHFVNQNNLNCKCSYSKSENCLGEILKDNFPEYEFIKIKPNWIKNKEGNNLELDFYCEYLKLAFEYQGLQHEQYIPFFHNNDINNFYKQQEHDRIKKEECEKRGIKLICIPSKYDYTNPLEMCEYILDNL